MGSQAELGNQNKVGSSPQHILILVYYSRSQAPLGNAVWQALLAGVRESIGKQSFQDLGSQAELGNQRKVRDAYLHGSSSRSQAPLGNAVWQALLAGIRENIGKQSFQDLGSQAELGNQRKLRDAHLHGSSSRSQAPLGNAVWQALLAGIREGTGKQSLGTSAQLFFNKCCFVNFTF